MVDTSGLLDIGGDDPGQQERELSKTAENALLQDQHERQVVRAAFKEYQENIKRSGTLRSEILKGAQAGDDPTELLLKAAECIGRMTGDNMYHEQVRRAVEGGE